MGLLRTGPIGPEGLEEALLPAATAFPEAMTEEPPDEDTEWPSLVAFPVFPATL